MCYAPVSVVYVRHFVLSHLSAAELNRGSYKALPIPRHPHSNFSNSSPSRSSKFSRICSETEATVDHTMGDVLPLQAWHEENKAESHLMGRSKLTSSTRQQRFRRLVARLWRWAWTGWTPEALSCILSCCAFASIIITLVLHHDKPLPEWPRLISINSLISIFTAIQKATLLLPVAEGNAQPLDFSMQCCLIE